MNFSLSKYGARSETYGEKTIFFVSSILHHSFVLELRNDFIARIRETSFSLKANSLFLNFNL